jgi:hypothetical protein
MTTRAAKKKADFEYVINDVLELATTDPVVKCFVENGIDSVASILAIPSLDVDILEYDSDGNGLMLKLNKGKVGCLKSFQAFYHHFCRNRGSIIPTGAWTATVTPEMFEDFRVAGYYDPNAPIIPYMVTIPSVTASAAAAAGRAPPPTPAENFLRGSKRDKSHYKAFKNEAQWDDWWRGFRATARTHQMQDVLNVAYGPTTPDEKALFDEKQAFMYSVLEDVLQTDMGKTLVRKHEMMTDAQKIISGLVTHMSSSTMAAAKASTLLAAITSARLGTARWNGTKRSYVLNWQDKVRE